MNRRSFCGKMVRAASGLMVPAAYGQALSLADPARQVKPVSAAGVSYLVEENCDGTGTPSGWTDSGSPNWDYTTSPAPLEGTQSLFVDGTDSVRHDFTDQDECWAYCMIHNVAVTVNQGPWGVSLLNTGTTVARGYILQSSMRPSVFAGSASLAGTPGDVATGVTYHFWLHFLKGTGADSTAEMWWGTTGDRSAALSLSKTDGNATAAANRVQILCASGNEFIIDKIRVSAEDMGSYPA